MANDNSRQSQWPVRAVLLVAAAGILIRLPSLVEPLGIDQGLWASSARGLDAGQVLYRDVWDHKPPGIFLVYWAAFRVFGWTAAAVNMLDVLASAATAALLFFIGRRLDRPMTGAAAAALYTVLTVPAWLYRYGGILERSVAENFVVVAVALAAWWACKLTASARLWHAWGIGLAAGAAVMFKPNAAVYPVAIAAWVMYAAPNRVGFSRRYAGPGLAAVAGAAVLPVLLLVWLAAQGALGDARLALLDFNRAYVRQDYAGGIALGELAIAFAKAVWFRIKSDPLWAAGVIGAVVAAWQVLRTRRVDTVAALAILWGAAAALAIFANGIRLYTTYFIQALAPLSLLGGWLLAAAGRSRVHRVAAVAAAVAMGVMTLVWKNYPLKLYDVLGADAAFARGRLPPEGYLDRFGGYANERGYSARANREVATYLQAHTQPGDAIYLFGINFSGVYFETNRPAAHRFLRVNVFTPSWFADPEFTLPSVVAALERTRPVYLIFERLHTETVMGQTVDALRDQPDIARLLGVGYRLETTIEDFTLFRRAD